MLNLPYDNFRLRTWLMPHVGIVATEIISPRGREASYR